VRLRAGEYRLYLDDQDAGQLVNAGGLGRCRHGLAVGVDRMLSWNEGHRPAADDNMAGPWLRDRIASHLERHRVACAGCHAEQPYSNAKLSQLSQRRRHAGSWP
jgi:hypothetical protein